MPLTQEQFQKARDSGFSTDQIIAFEKRRESESGGVVVEEQPSRRFDFIEAITGPKEDIPVENWMARGAYQTAKDVVGIPSDYINQRLLNYPRAIANKAGFDWPKPESGTAATLQASGGVAGGVQTGTQLAGRFGLLPRTTGVPGTSTMAEVYGSAPKIAEKGRNIVDTLMRGGAMASTYADTEKPFDPGQKAIQFLGGTALSGAAMAGGKAIEIGKNVVNKFRSFKQIPEIEKEVTRLKQAKESLQLDKETLGLQRRETLGTASRLERNVRTAAKEAKVSEAEKTRFLLQDTSTTLKHNVETLKQGLREASETGSMKFKEVLPKFFRENSDGYGQVLDNIDDKIVKSGQALTKGQVDDLMNATLSEVDDLGIVSGEARQQIEFLKNKYGFKRFPAQADARYTSGLSQVSALETNPNEAVNLRGFLSDLKMVRKTLSSGVKGGTGKFAQEDIPVAILNKNWGKFLENSPWGGDLKQLNADYKPVIDAMKMSSKIFKPYSGEYDVKAGAKFLEQFGMKSGAGAASQTDEALIQAIQEGSQFAEGTGGITDEIVNLGKQLQEAKDRVQPILQDIRNKSFLERQGVDKRLGNRLNQMAQRKDFIKSSYLEKENLIQEELKNHLKTLGFKEKELSELMRDKQKFYAVLKRLGYAAGLGIAAKSGMSFLYNAPRP